MLEQVMEKLRDRGSPGAHLGVSALNPAALQFYRHLGLGELVRTGEGSDRVIYLAKTFSGAA
jgi:ribosomal protein S18 acetylase RimI-like enzyme